MFVQYLSPLIQCFRSIALAFTGDVWDKGVKQGTHSSSEKRSAWWTELAGKSAWTAIQWINMTLRRRILRDDLAMDPNEQFIVVLWHNRIFSPCYTYGLSGSSRPMCVLTSASKDGAFLASIMDGYHMSAVRGSSGRRGVLALMEMKKELAKGKNMCITPDGPKGPCYVSQLGAVKIASMTGVPIQPLAIGYSDCWRVRKAWDQFCIPKPFSEVSIYWRDRIFVPPNLNESELEEYAKRVSAAIHMGAPDFEIIPKK